MNIHTISDLNKYRAQPYALLSNEALVIVRPTQCGVRRLVAAFRTMRRRVAALHKLTHRA